jgi:hypothetical protein
LQSGIKRRETLFIGFLPQPPQGPHPKLLHTVKASAHALADFIEAQPFKVPQDDELANRPGMPLADDFFQPGIVAQPGEVPPLLAYEGSDGVLEIYDGVKRATRVAKLLPGKTVKVEVIGKLKRPKADNRRVGDAL